jgi:hypothetical protein
MGNRSFRNWLPQNSAGRRIQDKIEFHDPTKAWHLADGVKKEISFIGRQSLSWNDQADASPHGR